MKRSNISEQIDFYERKARRFDRSITTLGSRENRNHTRKIEAIAEALGITENTTGAVLEVGTGTGLHARWLLAHSRMTYAGIDASQPMVALATNRLAEWSDRTHIAIGDAQELPFPDEAFPVAFCSGTLHNVNRPHDGVAELVRVTKRGGRVAVMEPNWKFPTVFFASAFSKIERNAFKISSRRLVEYARRAGLTEIAVRPLLYTPPKPKRLGDAFDRLDERLTTVPVLRAFSVMLLLTGTRPA